jgi:hypothetical protein
MKNRNTARSNKHFFKGTALAISLLGLAILCGVIITGFSSPMSEDKQLIERAILNYVEAFYETDTSKLYKSVAKDFSKRGYYTSKGTVVEAKMTFQQLIDLAKKWKQYETITASTPKKITVFDIMDKTASAKLEAKWGIDYFHLAKKDGDWIIINVLWQEYPTAKN